MSVLPVGFGESGGSYQIANSLRLRAAASAYLSRTFGAGDTQKWTLSLWLKRGELGRRVGFFSTHGTVDYFEFNADNTMMLTLNNNVSGRLTTTQVFRDPSAHMHIVIAMDTTQATAADRWKLYINGTQVTTFALASYPALNYNTAINSAVAHYIGADYALTAGQFQDGILSEPQLVGGSQLTAASFGETNYDGVWVPKAYTGTYGTNGFHLDFSDGTSATTLGYDRSGNANNWTLNNVSLTAGVTYDSMVDTPTNNYPVWNSLGNLAGMVLADGNLKITNANGDYRGCLASVAFPSSGKFYWEAQATSNPGPASLVNLGMATASVPLTGDQYGYTNSVGWYLYGAALTYWIAGGTTIGASTTSNVFQIAYDASTGKVWMGRDNTWYWGNTSTNNTTGDPAGGTNPSFTMSAAEFYAWMFAYSSGATANFGQRPFTYTPPTGFKALCTANMPVGSITTSGSFTGNASADGPFVWMNGVPKTLTINSNAVTFGTHADKTAGGFKLRTSSASYNTAGSNTWTATIDSDLKNCFKYNNAQGNP